MTRKGEVIKNLIEMSRFRKFAKITATAPARREGSKVVTADDLRRYSNEVDNALACVAAAIRATIKPKSKSWQKKKAEKLKAPVPKTDT